MLAERGAGDALIEHDLDSAGVERATIEEVLGGLESESLRARRVVDRRGPDAPTSGTCWERASPRTSLTQPLRRRVPSRYDDCAFTPLFFLHARAF